MKSFLFTLLATTISLPNALLAQDGGVNYEAELMLKANISTVCTAYKKNYISFDMNKDLLNLGLKFHGSFYTGRELEQKQSSNKVLAKAKDTYPGCFEKKPDNENWVQEELEARKREGREGITKLDPRTIAFANLGMNKLREYSFYKDYKWGPSGPWSETALSSNLLTVCSAVKKNYISDSIKEELIGVGLKLYNDFTLAPEEENMEAASKILKVFGQKFPDC